MSKNKNKVDQTMIVEQKPKILEEDTQVSDKEVNIVVDEKRKENVQEKEKTPDEVLVDEIVSYSGEETEFDLEQEISNGE